MVVIPAGLHVEGDGCLATPEGDVSEETLVINSDIQIVVLVTSLVTYTVLNLHQMTSMVLGWCLLY